MSEPVSLETRISRNTGDIEALYGLIQEFEGRTRRSFVGSTNGSMTLKARSTGWLASLVRC